MQWRKRWSQFFTTVCTSFRPSHYTDSAGYDLRGVCGGIRRVDRE